jgi:hypothetical protein
MRRKRNQAKIKKNEGNDFSDAEKRRYEDIIAIQDLLRQGYAPVRIKEMLSTTYNRIRRYATGDPENLCRFNGTRTSEAEQYRQEIFDRLTKNMTFTQAHQEVCIMGYRGKLTAFKAFCKKMIDETRIAYTPKRNMAGVPVNADDRLTQHYVSRTGVLKHIWANITLGEPDEAYIFSKYKNLEEIQQCVCDFRRIYNEGSVDLLDGFIKTYTVCSIKPIASFASGLRNDYEAVKNSVVSPLSNGFVEGINNKIKVIKRLMYGRAKLDLLRVRIIFAR